MLSFLYLPKLNFRIKVISQNVLSFKEATGYLLPNLKYSKAKTSFSFTRVLYFNK